ncbi:MAG TPA: tetratricopeptide repeat protein [Acidobacteriota bacterium]|nr:tetratricopeptide repeat protein [Acidobacteriota bacterium]
MQDSRIALENCFLRGPLPVRGVISRPRRVPGRIGEFICTALFLLLPGASLLAQSSRNPASPGSLNLGVQALYAGEYAKAEMIARQQLRDHSRSVDALVLLARVQMAQGKYPLAFDTLRKALRQSPDHVDALYFAGKLASALSQLEYRQLVQLAPSSSRVHQLMGDTYQSDGDLEKAQAEYRTALSLQPDLIEVELELAETLRTQGHFEEALKHYTAILTRLPRHFPSLFGTGLCFKGLQEVDKSIKFFGLAAGADPGDAPSRFALGAALIQKGEPGKAVEVLKSAVRLDPSLQGAYSLLGRALQLTGQPEQAALAFKQAQLLADQQLQSRQARMKKALDAQAKR